MLLFAPLPSSTNMEPTLAGILQKLETALGASAELLQQLQQFNQNLDGPNSARTSVAQIQALVQACAQEQQPILPSLEHSHAEAMLRNVAATLEEILAALDGAEVNAGAGVGQNESNGSKEGIEQAAFLCEFQLIPQLRITRENFYFWGYIDKDASLRQQYYAGEFAAHYQNQYVANHAELPYQVSVVVVAYNKLEMTRKCVESILENTDFAKLNAELILVDNGSSDGTLEFFKSVPQAKVIHFKHNMHIASFTMLPMICRSKYYVHVANDTVMTKDWLEILLQCMESDSKICLASPATCNISNWQGASVPTKDCTELVELAKQHNKANPLLWRERAQIYPPLGIFNLASLNQVGFWDPAFYSFYCCDDDFSLRARRAGFKHVLCEDVFCFHKSGGTLNEQIDQNIKVAGDQFKRKHGIEAWKNDVIFDEHIVKFLIQNCPDLPKINILSINAGIGDSLLQLKNLLREAGKEVALYHIVTQPNFLHDIQGSATEIVQVPAKELPKAVANSFAGVEFALFCTAMPFPHQLLTPELLNNLASRLVAHGALAVNVENPLSVYKVFKALNVGIPFNTLPYIGGAELNQLLTPHFKQIQMRVEVLKEITPEDMDNTLRPFNIELSPPLYELLRRRFYQCLAVK